MQLDRATELAGYGAGYGLAGVYLQAKNGILTRSLGDPRHPPPIPPYARLAPMQGDRAPRVLCVAS